MLQEILTTLNYIVTNFPIEGLVAAVTGSAALTPITRRLKAKSDLFKMTLVWLTFAAGAGIHYLSTTPTQDPRIIAIQASLLYVTSQPLYVKLFKPLAVWFGEQMSKAAAFDEQVKAAKAPVEPDTADFSH